MKDNKKIALSVISGLFLFGCLLNYNQPKNYKIGDFIKEQNAYYEGEVTSEIGKQKLKKFVTPSDSEYSKQKSVSHSSTMIGDIESVWDSYTGKGTTIAVIDDGFEYNHPDYIRSDGTNAILSTSRYYYLSGNSVLYQSYSSNPDCIKEDWDSVKSKWATHGTNTSSTAAAAINGIGGVGVAPDADILAIKTDFSFDSLVSAINYAVSQKVDVINMSLGAYAEKFIDGFGEQNDYSPSASYYFNAACKNAYDNGIIVVAAAGNEATSYKSYPACSTKVIGVGALGKGTANKLAPFTNYVSSSQTGEVNVDILAPGYVHTAGISGSNSSSYSKTYIDTQGTSFSSPMVAGAACLWKEKYPNGTPDEFLKQLQESALGIGIYANLNVPVSSYGDVGPSNITVGRLNVAGLMSIDDPYVSIDQTSVDISVGETKQLTLSSINGTISYSSANSDIAAVSSDGVVTGVKAGNTTITVTATKNSKSFTASVPVNVNEVIACDQISLSSSSIDVPTGSTYDVSSLITTSPADASRLFMYDSSDTSVATISDEGIITGIKTGTSTIDIVAVHGNGSASLTVNVTAPAAISTWERINSTTNLTNGDYLIVYEDNNCIFDGSLSTLDATSNYYSVTINENKITNSSSIESRKFTIESISGGYSIKSASGYYIGRETDKNGMDSSTTTKYVNTISFTGNNVDILGTSGRKMQYNTDASQNRFRYMSSSNSSNVQLYKSSSNSVAVPIITSVTLNENTLSLDVYNNANAALVATVTGENNPSKEVSWNSSDSSVATVDNTGKVVAINAGTAVIKATSTFDSTKYAECNVTVTDSTPITLSDISLSGYKTSFVVGDTFTFGGVVTASYSNSSTKDVTASCSFSGYDMQTAGTQTVTVTYTESDISKTKTYQIVVKTEAQIGSSKNFTIGWGNATGEEGTYQNFTSTSGTSSNNILSFSSSQNKASNAPFYSSNEIRLYYSSSGDGCSIEIKPLGGVTFTNFKIMATSTSYTPSVSYSIDGGSKTSASLSSTTYTPTSEFECTSSLVIQNANTTKTQLRISTIEITYTPLDESDKIVSSLEASYSGNDLYVNDSFDSSLVSVYANYTNSGKYPKEKLSSSSYSLSNVDTSSAGEKTIIVTYTGSYETLTNPLTTTIKINVIEDSLNDVTVTSSKTYSPGDVINKSDITVKLTFSSGKEISTTDFTFNNDGYMFTYDDAPSGGSSSTKTMSIVYNGNEYDFTVSISRKAPVTINGTNTNLSATEFAKSDVSKSSNTPSNAEVTIGNIAFAVSTNAYIYNSTYLSFGKDAGYIYNKKAFERDLTSLEITNRTSSARTDHVISISKTGEADSYVTYSQEEIAKGGYRYFKIEYTRTSSSYSNIASISFTLSGQDNVNNVSNYIMFEDTINQCNTKLDIAIDKLNSMSSVDKNTFSTSSDYVIATARERIEAWARNQGVELKYENSNFTYSAKSNLINNFINSYSFNSNIVYSLALISISFIGLILIKKYR